MRQKYRIIVEGMDGAGKTTLIEHLLINSKTDKFELIRNDLGHRQMFNEWWPRILEQEASPITPLHDRFFYSELVYGPIVRGHINADSNLIQNVLWFLRSTSLLIYARPHTDQLREGIKTNPHMEGVNDRFSQLLELYDQLMEAEKAWYGDRFIHYVWHREGETQRVEEVVGRYLEGEFG